MASRYMGKAARHTLKVCKSRFAKYAVAATFLAGKQIIHNFLLYFAFSL